MTRELQPIGRDAARVQLEHDVRDALQLALYHGMTAHDASLVLIAIAVDVMKAEPK